MPDGICQRPGLKKKLLRCKTTSGLSADTFRCKRRKRAGTPRSSHISRPLLFRGTFLYVAARYYTFLHAGFDSAPAARLTAAIPTH